MEKGRKVMELWDVIQGRSFNILSNYGPRGPCAKRGGREKTDKLSTFLRFFFKNCFPVSPTLTKALPYVFQIVKLSTILLYQKYVYVL